MKRIILAIAACGSSVSSPGHSEPMTFELSPWSAHYAVIEATGDIVSDTPAVLERFLSEGNYVAVRLNSEGENLAAAMRLGRIIRRSGMTTIIARDATCLSACAMAFLGGVHRNIEGLDRLDGPDLPSDTSQEWIGFHQFYHRGLTAENASVESIELLLDDVGSSATSLASETGQYLLDMGIDISLLANVADVDPDDMWYPNFGTLQSLRIISPNRVDAVDLHVDDGRAFISISSGLRPSKILIGCQPTTDGRLRPVLVVQRFRGLLHVESDDLEYVARLSDVFRLESMATVYPRDPEYADPPYNENYSFFPIGEYLSRNDLEPHYLGWIILSGATTDLWGSADDDVTFEHYPDLADVSVRMGDNWAFLIMPLPLEFVADTRRSIWLRLDVTSDATDFAAKFLMDSYQLTGDLQRAIEFIISQCPPVLLSDVVSGGQ